MREPPDQNAFVDNEWFGAVRPRSKFEGKTGMQKSSKSTQAYVGGANPRGRHVGIESTSPEI